MQREIYRGEPAVFTVIGLLLCILLLWLFQLMAGKSQAWLLCPAVMRLPQLLNVQVEYAGGPPAVLYMLLREAEPKEVGTASWPWAAVGALSASQKLGRIVLLLGTPSSPVGLALSMW